MSEVVAGPILEAAVVAFVREGSFSQPGVAPFAVHLLLGYYMPGPV